MIIQEFLEWGIIELLHKNSKSLYKKGQPQRYLARRGRMLQRARERAKASGCEPVLLGEGIKAIAAIACLGAALGVTGWLL